MTYQRLPYDDASTPTEMASDCRAVDVALHLPRQVTKVARNALDGRVHQPRAQVQRASIAVSDAAAKFAGRFLD
jgi:hypothetical protein